MPEKYPILLDPVRKQIIWGGRTLIDEFKIDFDGERLAEAWTLAVHPEGDNVILNGSAAGTTLGSYLGADVNGCGFGVMIKLIDACDRLSIQVHPVKTEMWYIVAAEPDAKLVYGLKDKFDEKTFRAALENGTVEELLNYVPVKAGEIYFIPQGLVHAIGKGILIAEIQQNSNVTYRVYDYNRRQKDGSLRQLHVEQAISVIKDFTQQDIDKIRYSVPCKDDGTLLASCELFRVNRYNVDGSLSLAADENNFMNILCLAGSVDVKAFGKTVSAGKGASVYIPAGAGKVEIAGNAELIVTTAPECASIE